MRWSMTRTTGKADARAARRMPANYVDARQRWMPAICDADDLVEPMSRTPGRHGDAHPLCGAHKTGDEMGPKT